MEYDNYKKLQEMLPDYVFDRLESSDKIFFESNLNKYPDLVEEVNQVKAVFNRFDKMEFEDKINHKARNFSLKVIEKREKKNSYKFSGSQYLIRFLVPAAIIIAVGMYYMGTPKLQKKDIPHDIDNKIASISDSLDNNEVTEGLVNYQQSFLTDIIIANNIENSFSEEISETLEEEIDISETDFLETFDTDIFSSNRILKKYHDLDENKFQEIYEELKNVKLID